VSNAGSGPATERQAKVMDNVIQTPGSACPWGENAVRKSLREDAAAAQHRAAPEPSYLNQQIHPPPSKR
jgi:hypothetical protein